MGSWILEAIKGSSFRTKLSALRKILFEKSKVPDIVKCALCPNMCRYACPVAIVDGRETTSPSGKSRIGYLLSRNHLDLLPENIEPLYYCLSCDGCYVHCFFNFRVSELTRGLRNRALESGNVPEQIKTLYNKIVDNRNPFGKIEKKFNQYPQGGEVLLLQDCITRSFYPELINKAVNLLERLGFKPFVIPEEMCCGYLLYEIGDDKTFTKIAIENSQIINSYKPKAIVSLCPECVYTYRVIYPRFKVNVKPPVKHITEILEERLNVVNFSEKHETVTIHEPPKLAIGLKKEDILVKILSKIPGLELKLPMRHGENTFYAGILNPLYWIDPALLENINRERLTELLEESDIIVTASPSAKKGLELVGGKAYDIVEFLTEIIK
ncbi:MAG: (Fe-S)-binding protein [Candidatus Njordarchaeales archaeon]